MRLVEIGMEDENRYEETEAAPINGLKKNICSNCLRKKKSTLFRNDHFKL